MKKFIFISTLTFLVCATAVAQTNFYDLYDYNNRSDFGYEIIESGQSYLIFGNSSGMGKFLNVDSTGNTIFHKHYSIGGFEGGGGWFTGYYGFGLILIKSKEQGIVILYSLMNLETV